MAKIEFFLKTGKKGREKVKFQRFLLFRINNLFIFAVSLKQKELKQLQYERFRLG